MYWSGTKKKLFKSRTSIAFPCREQLRSNDDVKSMPGASHYAHHPATTAGGCTSASCECDSDDHRCVSTRTGRRDFFFFFSRFCERERKKTSLFLLHLSLPLACSSHGSFSRVRGRAMRFVNRLIHSPVYLSRVTKESTRRFFPKQTHHPLIKNDNDNDDVDVDVDDELAPASLKKNPTAPAAPNEDSSSLLCYRA